MRLSRCSVPGGFALAALLAATPARAAGAVTVESVLADAQRIAAEVGEAAAAYWQRLVAGDMAAIQGGAFALSGLVAAIGLWLLVRSPHVLELELDLIVAEADETESTASGAEAERPPRLLEAIAAAKAQMAISMAERKHVR